MMTHNHKIEKRLNVFEQPEAWTVMVQLLRLFDTEISGEQITKELPDESYLVYVQMLKLKYEKERIVDKGIMKQIDLEDSIKEIKDEQERESR